MSANGTAVAIASVAIVGVGGTALVTAWHSGRRRVEQTRRASRRRPAPVPQVQAEPQTEAPQVVVREMSRVSAAFRMREPSVPPPVHARQRDTVSVQLLAAPPGGADESSPVFEQARAALRAAGHRTGTTQTIPADAATGGR